jgi:hypothetical protein
MFSSPKAAFMVAAPGEERWGRGVPRKGDVLLALCYANLSTLETYKTSLAILNSIEFKLRSSRESDIKYITQQGLLLNGCPLAIFGRGKGLTRQPKKKPFTLINPYS